MLEIAKVDLALYHDVMDDIRVLLCGEPDLSAEEESRLAEWAKALLTNAKYIRIKLQRRI